MIESTMPDFPLTTRLILEHGRTVHAGSEVVTDEAGSTRRASFATVAERSERLAAALKRLGVAQGDAVGTLCWNTQEHMEAYLAVPTMGAVLHTLNLRLFPEQLSYVINHAGDRVILVHDSLIPVLAKVMPELKTVAHVIVIGNGDASEVGREVLRYEDLLAAESPGFAWPDVRENAASSMCYTSGTTGDPKGVVYSHRSLVVHTWGFIAASGMNGHDRILPIAPMFHANGWTLPYDAWFIGADLILAGRYAQAEPLCGLIEREKVTVTAAVPTVLNDVLRYAEATPVDFSSLRLVLCAGSAVPRALSESFFKRAGVRLTQAWGMTETSPLGVWGEPPKGIRPEDEPYWREKQGRIAPGVELRVVAEDGTLLPWDGQSIGEIEVRGPWVTTSYHLDPAEEKFHDGWLRTGDVGTVDELGFLQITDRTKDVIKSGGEWISSVELENLLMGHPDVVEATVIGVPDTRWDERPLALIVAREGCSVVPEDLRGFLGDKVARWWLPERWSFVEEIPKTSVGKFDKKLLRSRYEQGGLTVSWAS
jgi:fatty-acyl-CoA synthase